MATPVIIDIVAAGILLFAVVLGAKRGLFRALAGLLILALALTGARFAAQTLTPPAVRIVEPWVEKQIAQKLEDALPSSEQELSPEENEAGELLRLLGIQGERLETLTEQAQETVRNTGVSVLSAVAAGLAESILYGVLYILAFVLLLVLLNLLAKVLDLAMKLPLLHGANALGGAVVGLVGGAVVLMVLTVLLRRMEIPLEGSYLFEIYTTVMS